MSGFSIFGILLNYYQQCLIGSFVMKLDLEFVRSQFPAFSEPSLEGWAFFENAGGSYPCQQFIHRLTDFYMKNKVQVNYP